MSVEDFIFNLLINKGTNKLNVIHRLNVKLTYRYLYSLSDKIYVDHYEQELFALTWTGNSCITISFLQVKFYPPRSCKIA